ncbi:MAG: ribosomal protein L11 methyltransferase [Gammaproteobacteria bacterium]|nr:MAG: ribosomal protein L11 methyltransferase [Gammaproteobacteria bacterium]
MSTETAGGWLRATVVLPREHLPAAEALLETLGALALTVRDAGDDPVFEPPPGQTPLWAACRLDALFPAAADGPAQRRALRRALAAVGCPTVRFLRLAERDWARLWMKHFKPMRFGSRLCICPSHRRPPANADIVLRLDPGLAFGTGAHPSTALCLEWLDAHAAALAGARVLDYGCGSGVLALAAAALGATRVCAVDVDPQALAATAANAAANGLAEAVEIHAAGAEPAGPYTLVVANIVSGVLIELAPTLTARLAPGGTLLLAGVLSEQIEAVCAAYRPQLRLAHLAARGPWCLLGGRAP